jgi:hypothetical protein
MARKTGITNRHMEEDPKGRAVRIVTDSAGGISERRVRCTGLRVRSIVAVKAYLLWRFQQQILMIGAVRIVTRYACIVFYGGVVELIFIEIIDKSVTLAANLHHRSGQLDDLSKLVNIVAGIAVLLLKRSMLVFAGESLLELRVAT